MIMVFTTNKNKCISGCKNSRVHPSHIAKGEISGGNNNLRILLWVSNMNSKEICLVNLYEKTFKSLLKDRYIHNTWFKECRTSSNQTICSSLRTAFH